MQETWVPPRVRKTPWRREWQPVPVFLSGEVHGQRILAGYSPWSCKESDTTERRHFHFCTSHPISSAHILCLSTACVLLPPLQPGLQFHNVWLSCPLNTEHLQTCPAPHPGSLYHSPGVLPSWVNAFLPLVCPSPTHSAGGPGKSVCHQSLSVPKSCLFLLLSPHITLCPPAREPVFMSELLVTCLVLSSSCKVLESSFWSYSFL